MSKSSVFKVVIEVSADCIELVEAESRSEAEALARQIVSARFAHEVFIDVKSIAEATQGASHA